MDIMSIIRVKISIYGEHHKNTIRVCFDDLLILYPIAPLFSLSRPVKYVYNNLFKHDIDTSWLVLLYKGEQIIFIKKENIH